MLFQHDGLENTPVIETFEVNTDVGGSEIQDFQHLQGPDGKQEPTSSKYD